MAEEYRAFLTYLYLHALAGATIALVVISLATHVLDRWRKG